MKNKKREGSSTRKWFIIGLLGLVVLLALGAALIFFVLDYTAEDIWAIAEEIPVLSWFLPDAELKAARQQIEILEARLNEAEELLANHKEALKMADEQIGRQEAELRELTAENQSLSLTKEEERLSQAEREAQLKKLANMYASMSASRAAPIIENLTLMEAALILEQMNQRDRAQLMARMEPAHAARLTVVMKEMDQADNPEVAALQERLLLLMDSVQDAKGELSLVDMVATFEEMSPAHAAQILSAMEADSSQLTLARNILTHMSDASRARIFEQMEPDTARTYVHALAQ